MSTPPVAGSHFLPGDKIPLPSIRKESCAAGSVRVGDELSDTRDIASVDDYLLPSIQSPGLTPYMPTVRPLILKATWSPSVHQQKGPLCRQEVRNQAGDEVQNQDDMHFQQVAMQARTALQNHRSDQIDMVAAAENKLNKRVSLVETVLDRTSQILSSNTHVLDQLQHNLTDIRFMVAKVPSQKSINQKEALRYMEMLEGIQRRMTHLAEDLSAQRRERHTVLGSLLQRQTGSLTLPVGRICRN